MSEETPKDKPGNPPAPEADKEEPIKEKPGADKAAAPAAQQAPVTEPKSATSKSSGGNRKGLFFSVLFNLVLVAGIGYTAYMVYEQGKAVNVLFEQQNTLTAERNASGNRIDGLQDTIEILQSELGAAREEAAALVQAQAVEVERLQNELVSTRLRITENNPGASQEWLLAEAASLLRLAQQQVVMSRNIRTAQALFIAADDVLRLIDDPAIFSVREILAGELAALRAVPETDIQAIYLQLGGLAEQVVTLQVNNDLATQLAQGEPAGVFDATGIGEEGVVSRFFSRIKSTMNNYFVVRRRDTPIQPLLTPGQEAALMQSILLQIEQGRTALLKGEQEIYTNSLTKAHDTIASYLAGEAAARASILSALENLAGQRVVTESPPLNRTRQALEQILSVNNPARADAPGQ